MVLILFLIFSKCLFTLLLLFIIVVDLCYSRTISLVHLFSLGNLSTQRYQKKGTTIRFKREVSCFCLILIWLLYTEVKRTHKSLLPRHSPQTMGLLSDPNSNPPIPPPRHTQELLSLCIPTLGSTIKRLGREGLNISATPNRILLTGWETMEPSVYIWPLPPERLWLIPLLHCLLRFSLQSPTPCPSRAGPPPAPSTASLASLLPPSSFLSPFSCSFPSLSPSSCSPPQISFLFSSSPPTFFFSSSSFPSQFSSALLTILI